MVDNDISNVERKKLKQSGIVRKKNQRKEPMGDDVKLDALVLAKDLEDGSVCLMEKDTRRRFRNLVVDYNLVRLRSSGMPDEMLGFLVKSIHFHTPYYFLLMFLLLPYKVAPYVMIPLVVCLIAFFYFDGCFLTIIEYRLTSHDMNIIDPYIYALGSVPTPKRRYYYTLGVTSVYFVLVVFLIIVRNRFSV